MDLALRIRNKVRLPLPVFSAVSTPERFECPICRYSGPFRTMYSFAGNRRNAVCPRCGSLERHRLQYLVFEREIGPLAAKMKILHVAPEPFLETIFRKAFGEYDSADLEMERVTYPRTDLTRLPFKDASYDVVYASHVLEHIQNDSLAISEIYRVLRPRGIAVLPVPIVSEETIEYPQANPAEAYHWRAPGVDYFERYRALFQTVRVFSSADFPGRFQTFIYEDRSRWPTVECPMRKAMAGTRHSDFVPVCQK